MVSKPYQGIVANNEKGIGELSKNKSKYFFKNSLNDSDKSTVYTS
jgi:hypothetical protein